MAPPGEEEERRTRASSRVEPKDLILPQFTFAFVMDLGKGPVSVHVGPRAGTPQTTETPVLWDPESKRFVPCDVQEAVQTWPSAREGEYLVLVNPAKEGQKLPEHPQEGQVNTPADLDMGKRVIFHGPVTFPLWPAQSAQTIPGHTLRLNEYLVAQVYNAEEARANWDKTVARLAEGEEKQTKRKTPVELPANLVVGQRLIIKGTDVSFYMPPTGVEVIQDESKKYVRQAVTLERLDFCILTSERGDKRIVVGPQVVFPEPNEEYMERDGLRKFRALELPLRAGIHVKVIADYEDPKGVKHAVGEELFFTGDKTPIYFPREEHAIVKYGDRDVYFGVEIPPGEGLYVLDRLTGVIRLEKGPAVFLPDPRKEVIVRRILTEEEVDLWFPGDVEAKAAYGQLREAASGEGRGRKEAAAYLAEPDLESLLSGGRRREQLAVRGESAILGKGLDVFAGGHEVARRTAFTPPRTLVLDTRFKGAVPISVLPGNAIMVVKRTGERRVVLGPATILLEYDETLMPLKLSTGRPKTDTRPLKTVYLRVWDNRVGDMVEVITKDEVRVNLTVTYRVKFIADKPEAQEKWFDVEDYTGLLADHTRSMIRAAAKRYGIEEFYGRTTEIVRDQILGESKEGKRTGRFFTENQMIIYDVEVLEVKMEDPNINKLLIEAQHEAVRQKLEVDESRRRLAMVKQGEELAQEEAAAKAITAQKANELRIEEIRRTLALNLEKAGADLAGVEKDREVEAARQKSANSLQQAQLARSKAVEEQKLALAKAAEEQRLILAKTEMLQELEQMKAEVDAVVSKAGAISPDLIAALQAFGDAALMEKMADTMAPLAILGGKSVAEVVSQLFAGTPLAAMFANRMRRE